MVRGVGLVYRFIFTPKLERIAGMEYAGATGKYILRL